MFSNPPQTLLERLGPELVDYAGNSYTNRLILLDGKPWFVKVPHDADTARRELLASELAQGWLNVPRIRLLTDSEHAELISLRPEMQRPGLKNFLVDVVQELPDADLPIKDLTDATAAEVVFSLWIRRRDAHFSNRAMSGTGLPGFFDFHVAFAKEHRFADLTTFLAAQRDFGYPRRWRLFILEPGERPDVVNLRRKEATEGFAFQPIYEKLRFGHSLSHFAELVQQQDRTKWLGLISSVGYAGEEASFIDQVLASSQAGILDAVTQITQILELPLELTS